MRVRAALAARIAVIGSVLAGAACHRSSPAPAPSPESDPSSPPGVGVIEPGTPDPASAGEPSDGGRAVLAARCRVGGASMSVASDAGADDLSIGDAVPYPGGYAVGLVRRTAAGRVAAIALVGAGGAPGKVIDLGPTLGDAPPPRVVWRAPELVAAAYQRQGAGPNDARSLGIYTLAPSDVPTVPTLAAAMAQQRDDSLAFDLAVAGADGVVVWDEAAGASRGVIRAAPLAKAGAPAQAGQAGQAGPAVRDVSPPDSDAELPRIVHLGWPGAPFGVVWIARQPEPSGADASSPAQETTGEARAFGWLEMVALDGHGAPVGPVRRLTPASGHVSAYDVEVRAAESALLVVARDDGEAVDGSGGALLRVRVRSVNGADGVGGDTIEAPVAYATDGLGRGGPVFVSTGAPTTPSAPSAPALALALAWIGPGEQVRLLPLDSAGSPTAAPSAEDTMNDARPLVFLSGAGALLVATPGDATSQLRVFACSR